MPRKVTETSIQQAIRLALADVCTLFRNNVGLAEYANGQKVKYGLCDGSSDLIGWTRVDGHAIFTAIEVKTPSGKIPTPAQRNFIEQVNKAGGIAFVARSPEEALVKIQRGIERMKQ